jgi:hypothetical protein
MTREKSTHAIGKNKEYVTLSTGNDKEKRIKEIRIEPYNRVDPTIG